MKIDKALLSGSTSFLILRLLYGKRMYGYEIIKELETTSGNVFSLKEGTLYPILHSLEKDGLVKSLWEASETGRKRKFYEITEEGKSELIHRQEEWKVFTRAVDQVLNPGVTYAV